MNYNELRLQIKQTTVLFITNFKIKLSNQIIEIYHFLLNPFVFYQILLNSLVFYQILLNSLVFYQIFLDPLISYHLLCSPLDFLSSIISYCLLLSSLLWYYWSFYITWLIITLLQFCISLINLINCWSSIA